MNTFNKHSKPLIQKASSTKKTRISNAGWAAIGFLPLALPLAISAHAEGNAGRYEFTPYVGQNMFENKQNLADDVVYGLRLGHYFTDNFELEGAVGFVGTNVDDSTLVGAIPGRYRSPTDNVDVLFYNLDALYNFSSESRFTPYIVAGVGGTHYKPSISTKDMATLNAGVGFKFAFNDNLALRLDVRDLYVGELFQESFNNIQTTLGLAFTFGDKRQKYEPVAAMTPAPVIKPMAPKPAPEPVVAPTPKVVVLNFEDVHFNYDQSALTPEARQMLKQNIGVLKSNPNTKVRIAGYTSASGTEEYNTALSQRRAKAIESYLISEGINANRLSVIGYGEAHPAEHEANTANLESSSAKANMRALFEIVVHE